MANRVKTVENVTFGEIEGLVNGLVGEKAGDGLVVVDIVQVQVVPYFVIESGAYNYDLVVVVEVGPAIEFVMAESTAAKVMFFLPPVGRSN
jgi:ABC-type antimicrobial peptide transport system ATPase subunit